MSFCVAASSGTTLSYQWLKNGASLSGATKSSYAIAAAEGNDAGTYAARVTNAGGSVMSSNATLTVVSLPVSSGDLACVAATNVSACSWSHNVGSGENRVLVVGIGLPVSSATVSSVSYGGMPLTRIISTRFGNPVEMWFLLAPPLGTAQIEAVWTGNGDMTGWSGTFANVDQANPIRSFAATGSSSGVPTITVASMAGDLVVDTVSVGGDAVSLAPGPGQTQICQNRTGNAAGDCWGAASFKPGVGNVTMSWATGSVRGWGIAATVLKAAPVPQADLAAKVLGPTAVASRIDFPCAICITNLGPQTASNIVIALSLPAGINPLNDPGGAIASGCVTWTIPSLASTETGSFPLRLKASSVGQFTLSATVSADTTDIHPANDTSSLVFTVTNTPPLAHNQSVTTPESTAMLIALTGSDANGDVLTFELGTVPSHGTISSFNPESGILGYAPYPGFFGVDSFTFIVKDGFTQSGPGTVTITVTPIAPEIDQPPQGRTIIVGRNVLFGVEATGTAPLTYQWHFNGTPLAGATDSLLALKNVQPDMGGSYTVVVTNDAGSAVSAPAVLTVLVPPTVATLAAASVTSSAAVLNALVNPQGLPTACWFQYGVSTNYGFCSATNVLAGSNTDVPLAVAVTGLAPGTVFHYRVVATNSAGLTVGQDATFTTLTTSFSVTCSLTASGGPMQLSLTGIPGAKFTVLTSSNSALSFESWTVLGDMTEVSPGQYQYSDPRPATASQCYYRIVSRLSVTPAEL